MTNPYPGKFITIEGPDASGKTSSIEDLKRYFANHTGFLSRFDDVLFMREPGGTEINDQIRDVILSNHGDEKLHSKTQVFLFAANRYQNLKEIIIPALKANKLVICDRFLLSTLAYQTKLVDVDYQQQIDQINNIMDIHKQALFDDESGHFIIPDMTVYFDIEQQTIVNRMKERLENNVDDIDVNDQALLDSLSNIDHLRQQYTEVYKLAQNNAHPLIDNVYAIDANQERNNRLHQILDKCQIGLDMSL